MTKFYTSDRVTGNKIEMLDTIEEAREAIRGYEEEDKANGCFEADYYAIEDEDYITVESGLYANPDYIDVRSGEVK